MEKFIPEILETERLILRPLTMEDKPAIYKWASDPEVARFMLYSQYRTPDDADIWLENLYTQEKQLDYGFVWKETGELIGSGGLIFKPEEDCWSVGYNLRHDMWGKGIVPEACKKIIEYARANYEVKCIRGCFAKDNQKSGRVMEKLGMHYLKDCEYTKFDGSATFAGNLYEIRYDE